ncbi:MAG: hypothetical protein ACK5LG_23735, partial [Bacteroides thetaiotaomicron]
EAYLLGPDNTLRSDTYLEPDTKNIVNSFKNPDQGTIKSVAASSVLAGESNTIVADDYRGVKSIISYQPISVFDQNWSLVVKQDESERMRAVYSLIFLMIVVAGGSIAAIIAFARKVTKSIENPVVSLSQWAQKVAGGSLEIEEI